MAPFDFANDAQVEITIQIVEIVEIEIYGRDNRPPPPAKAYQVRIDHERYVFETRHVTGRTLLMKAGKTPPEHYEIEKRMHGGKYVAVGLDEMVDLGEPGIEVFETFPLDETEG
jgi:hypothetical protein